MRSYSELNESRLKAVECSLVTEAVWLRRLAKPSLSGSLSCTDPALLSRRDVIDESLFEFPVCDAISRKHSRRKVAIVSCDAISLVWKYFDAPATRIDENAKR